jgi:proteic killer suppression protein
MCHLRVDSDALSTQTTAVIRSWRHKGLRELHETGRARRTRPDLQQRIGIILDALDSAGSLRELNLPGFALHPLRGGGPVRYSIRVNGPWRITFGFHDGDGMAVDLEQYH